MDKPDLSRRRLLRLGAAAVPLAALGPALVGTAFADTAFADTAPAAGPAPTLRMPAETDPHVRTFMACPARAPPGGSNSPPCSGTSPTSPRRSPASNRS